VLAIPVGRPVDVRVTSTDVIHSFWVPRLAGKIDAIPGHVNVIRISADRPGVYRGQCSEFCGTGHATMDFRVEALTEEEFSRFLAASEIQQDSGFWQEGRP
jgi:cytochrome c oxidase subunit 2